MFHSFIICFQNGLNMREVTLKTPVMKMKMSMMILMVSLMMVLLTMQKIYQDISKISLDMTNTSECCSNLYFVKIYAYVPSFHILFFCRYLDDEGDIEVSSFAEQMREESRSARLG